LFLARGNIGTSAKNEKYLEYVVRIFGDGTSHLGNDT
jgi:hypothetical protein